MKHTLRTVGLALGVFPLGVGLGCRGAGTGSEPAATQTAMEETDFRLRSDVEAALPGRA